MISNEITDNVISTSSSGLLMALSDRTTERIEEIRANSEQEIAAIKEKAESDISEFSRKEKESSDRIIAYEEEKIENRNTIDRKKTRLLVIEEFIEAVTAEVVAEIREAPDYISSNIKSLSGALSEDRGALKVYTSSIDGDLRKSLVEFARGKSGEVEIEVLTYDEIKMVGIIIEDEKSGIIINSTVDRTVYRKREIIRREIFRIISGRGIL